MNKPVIIFGAILVVAGGAAMYLRQELRTQREQNAAAMAQVTTLESAHSNGSMVAQQGIGSAQAATWNPATAAQTALLPTAPAARDQGADRKGSPEMALMEQMLNSPAGREMQRTMARQMLEQKFPDLAKDLNLSKEAAGKLLDLLTKQQLDLAAEFMGEQGDQSRNRAESQQATAAEIKTLLGDSYSKWGEYQTAASQRQQEGYKREASNRLRSAITDGGPPLTDAQFEQLNSALTAEQRRIDREPGAATMQQQMQRLPESNRRLAEVAASHLSPQQLDQYKLYLQEQQEMLGEMDALSALFGEDE